MFLHKGLSMLHSEVSVTILSIIQYCKMSCISFAASYCKNLFKVETPVSSVVRASGMGNNTLSVKEWWTI